MTDYYVGDTWVFVVHAPLSDIVSIVVTDPADEVVAISSVEADGEVTVSAPLESVGRYLAVVVVAGDDDVADVQAHAVYAVDPSETGELPGLAEVKAYLSTAGETSADDTQVLDALATETEDQRDHCDVPAAYPFSLRQALKRRVARNLANRLVPIAKVTSFGEGGSVSERVTRYDAEVTRFEARYRKTVVG